MPTIVVSKETHERLAGHKVHKNESFNDVIERFIDKVENVN